MFTLIDATVLIAATAVALVPIRYAYASGMLEALPPPWTPASVLSIVLELHWILAPPLVTWSLAVWVLRLRQPRPRLRRLFRQAGMAATTAILLTVLLLLIKIFGLFGVAFVLDPNRFATSGDWLVFEAVIEYPRQHLGALCDAVLAVWLVLWLARVWRCEASWVDRVGRALGILGVAYGLLFSCLAFMG